MRLYVYGKPEKHTSIPLFARSILEVLLGLAMIKKKKYCWPTQKTILRLLMQHKKIDMSRRTLNRCLRWLEDYGYIRRMRRHRRAVSATGYGKDGMMKPCSTLYQFGGKAFNFLRTIGKSVLDLFSNFSLPGWEKAKIRDGKSALLGSLKNFLINLDLDRATVAGVFGLRA